MRSFVHRILTALVVVVVAALAPVSAHDTDGSERVEPGLLSVAAPIDVLVRFEDAVPAQIASGRLPGMTPRYVFSSLPAVSATVTPAALRALAARDDLAYIEADKPVALDLDSATIASRARDVFDPAFDPDTPPVTDDGGDPVDGRGVGIAIVDVGLDGLHPDYQAPGKVGGNWRVTPAGLVPMTYSSAIEDGAAAGHGTHVAGIAAGTGLSSGGSYRGAAPGATLYAFSFYTAVVSHPAVAFDWILQHGHEQNPPIRVVNNSWHCGAISCLSALNPNQLHVQLATRLAKAGYVITWAAGNVKPEEGNDGSFSVMNAEAINPEPGIIGVANYRDDYGPVTGVRDGCVYEESARGASGDPTTWPDVAAPGTSITSTWAMYAAADRSGRTPDNQNAYKALTGTSMAAPHVAGIVAQMLQAEPTLTPAEVEYVVKATATKLSCGVAYVRADPAHPYDGANYVDGHGLVHAYDAVALADGFDGVPPAGDPEPLPDGFSKSRPGIDVTRTLYLQGDTGLTESYPDAPSPRARALAPASSTDPSAGVTHLSEPLTDPIVADGISLDAYIGTTGELIAKFNPPGIYVAVSSVAPSGAVTELGADGDGLWQILPLGPTQRTFTFRFGEPITIPAGHRVRVNISVGSPPLSGIEPAPIAFWTLWTEGLTPSRVGFGTVVEEPAVASRAGCETRQDCAMVDATHPFESLTCGSGSWHLTWHGPAGSSLTFTCAGQTYTCTVVAAPGTEGSCATQVDLTSALVYKAGSCGYLMPDGSRGGSGRCVSDRLIEDDD